MSDIIHSATDYIAKHGTYKGYYEQYKNTAKTINIGDSFVVMPNNWQEETIKILYTDETVALGVVTKGCDVGSKSLYHNSGEQIGWRYNDIRADYRLQYINKEGTNDEN